MKHTFNESYESLLERWMENPYWQAFYGFTTLTAFFVLLTPGGHIQHVPRLDCQQQGTPMQDAISTHKIMVWVTQEEFQDIRQQAYQRKLDRGPLASKWIQLQLPKSAQAVTD